VSSRSVAELGGANPAAALTEFLAREQKAGRLIDAEPAVLIRVLRAVLVLPMHTEEPGDDHFPQILDLVIELAAGGLTTKGNQHDT
jgi:hypothetical protein